MFPSNEDLWKQLLNGEQKAIEDLYKINYQVLYSYAYRITHNKEMSKDCVQEVFVKLWENKDKIGSVSRVKSYLLKSVWRSSIKKIKLEKKFFSINEDKYNNLDVVFSTETKLIIAQREIDNNSMLKSAIEKLTTREKEMLFMQYYEGLTISEIQEITDLKYQSIKNYTYRALTTLRKLYGKKSGELHH